MFRTTLKSINAHKRRLVATSMAILLGVAFLSGTLVLGDTMRADFNDLFSETNAGTDALVRNSTEVGSDDFSQRGLLDQSVADQVAEVDGVASVSPQIESAGQIVGSDGDPLGGNGPPTLAANWIEDPALNPYDLAEGRAPEEPGEVVIDRRSAEEGDLAVGDTTTLRVPEPIEVSVVGIATFGDADSSGPVTWAGLTTAYAQEVLLPRPDALTGVVVAADEGISQTELVDRLASVLPSDAEALTGAELTAEQQDEIEGDFVGFLEMFLLAFAGVALLVATFTIYNTFSILVAQRTRESALLRALGASRRQVLASITVEAALVGVVASVLGIAAGLGLATGLMALMDAAGFGLPSSGLVMATSTFVTAMLVGVLVTLAASLAPAVKASRVAPLAALRDVAIDRSGASLWRALAGTLVSGIGIAMTIGGTTGEGSLAQSGLGAMLTVVGVVLLGPIAARPASSVLGGVLAYRGMSGKLARRNALRNPRRTAGTASALMVGVAVVTLFTVVAASIKSSIDDVVSEQFAGDLVIVNTNFSGSGLDPELAQAIGDLPEVEVATGIGTAPMTVDGDDDAASVVDPEPMTRMMDLEVSEGSMAELDDGQVALHEDFARDHSLGLGDPVPVGFADGTTDELTLGAIFANNELMGDVILSNGAWASHSSERVTDDVVLMELGDGVSTTAAQPAIQAVADDFGAPDVQDRQEYIDSVAGEVDQMLTIIYALLVLAIIIALMGIANTLSLSIHERTRELGLLRAVGQTRRQLRSMVRGEAIVVALFGTIGGLGLGTFLGWALVEAISAAEGLGSFAVPGGQLAVVVGLGALVGVIAAVRPARRAARMDVLAAIATD
ncbi:MAG: ABC transporter permease [Acidimicrobiales bacterium]